MSYLLFGKGAPILGVMDHETLELLRDGHFDKCDWFLKILWRSWILGVEFLLWKTCASGDFCSFYSPTRQERLN